MGKTIIFLLIFPLVFSQKHGDSLNMSFLDPLVITGSKTLTHKKSSPISVSVIDQKSLQNVQACFIADGLKFQPGLRVETDCQTCNYTQLRMNGLQGGYSQILINGRPIFSSLLALYGLEQLPVNMVDRIEVTRGGGASIHGSSAIGGTVNIITKLPKANEIQIGSTYQNIGGQTGEYQSQLDISRINKSKTAGIYFSTNHRYRDFFDANEDNFSEIPKLKTNAYSLNGFYKHLDNQKLEVSLNYIREYRKGGEMLEKEVHLLQQAEERLHQTWMGNIDYQINFNNNSLIIYSAFQNAKRKHYTGVLPDTEDELKTHLQTPPYGDSYSTMLQTGFQFNHDLSSLFKRRHVLSIGGEYLSDQIFDEIKLYQYLVNQHTKNFGAFIQSDWNFAQGWTLLSGLRADRHNFLPTWIFNPRFALLYQPNSQFQIRLGYGKGFRAPQAFDSDLHMAFAGGGVSRVRLSQNLHEERSNSYNISINYDKIGTNYIYGFSLEGFFTRLNDVFIRTQIGADAIGEIFEKQNGYSAMVKGLTLELRANYQKQIQLESGFTLQKSFYSQAIEVLQNVQPQNVFMRTPDFYGFANLNITPNKKLAINLNYVFTGKMLVPHITDPQNLIIKSPSFHELNFRINHSLTLSKKNNIEFYYGLKNILNQYQSDFDCGKNRDSNYIYGPSLPRSFFLGLKFNII